MPTRFASTLLLGLLLVSAGLAQPPIPPGEKLPLPKLETMPPVENLPPPIPPAESVPLPAVDAGCCAPRTVPITQVLLVPHQTATTMPDWKLRDIEVGRTCSGPVLEFREEKQTITELRLEEREVEEQVVCIESKPITVTDPCTGHCHTEYEDCPVVKTVKVKTYHTVPVQRDVIVRIPCLKPGPEMIVKKLQLSKTTIPAIETTLSAVTTHNEVPVPVCPVLPPPACPNCAPPGHP